MWFFSKRYFPFWAVFAALLTTACNKDEVILDDRDHAPVITLDSESGVYTVKMGRELTIAPTVEYAEGATYSWIVDGKLAGSEPTYTAVFTELGEVYITFRVETATGKAEAELRVDVLELTPPVISLALPAEGLKVLPGVEYTFAPDIQHSDQEDFRCRWLCAGEVVSTQMSYTFREETVGSYPIRIEASNDDGTSVKEFVVEVVEKMPSEVRFEKLSHYCKTTDRSTFVGRAVYLAPSLAYVADPQFAWSVDGEPVAAETGAVFKFTPDGPGDYTVRVDVTEGGDASERLTRNIVRGVVTLSAEIVVHAFADEEQRRRPASAASSRFQNAVYEFLPAPGQLVGEKTEAGYTGNERTHEDAVAYAAGRLEARSYVSLGGFGGYLIVGFDHSIARMESGYDFSIQGNAFDTSSEPGVVWVMQDVNGNGEPDDEWYELRGSETGKEGTVSGYAVTYYRPAGKGMDVQWTDSEGHSGTIEYKGEFHDQDFYYPAWAADTYTLRGTLLESRNMVDDRGFWINRPYEWGYADNYGSDCLAGGDAMDGKGQSNGFRIANAMQPDGTPVELKYIDFVKVQVGVNAKSGPLGEVSTEVFSFADLSIAE